MMSIEQLILNNPDRIVILGTDSDKANDNVQSLSNISGLDAVQNDRIYVLTHKNAFGTGPSTFQMINKLKELMNVPS